MSFEEHARKTSFLRQDQPTGSGKMDLKLAEEEAWRKRYVITPKAERVMLSRYLIVKCCCPATVSQPPILYYNPPKPH